MSTDEDLFSGFSEEMKKMLSRVNTLSPSALSTDSAIAREFGVNRGNPAQWRKRGTTPFDIFINYAKKNEINIHWLLTGEGEPSLSHLSTHDKEQRHDIALSVYACDIEAEKRVQERNVPITKQIKEASAYIHDNLVLDAAPEDYELVKAMLFKLALQKNCESSELKGFIDYLNRHGQQDNANEFAMIPGYNVQVSAGHGAINSDEQPTRYLAFRHKWLKYRGFNEKDLVVVFAKGDSMEPTISNNNSLLIMTKIDNIQDGSIYVIRQDDTLLVKRVQRLLDGNLKLISDNMAYEPMVLSKDSFESLDVVGQVVWIAKDIG
ncbi:LexA family transcriptional regulator [Cognaticolwellia mytili]|uniref:LexA family transcriptional regulator n=1 Tax=Cognaticolwellia mytili TaxID=1888913 RepID=UPI000A176A99|nr:LexA family transcriptional regulator [Cognaticolwellia mytili]